MSEEKKEFEPMKELTDDVLERINGGANDTCQHFVCRRNAEGQNICLVCGAVVPD